MFTTPSPLHGRRTPAANWTGRTASNIQYNMYIPFYSITRYLQHLLLHVDGARRPHFGHIEPGSGRLAPRAEGLAVERRLDLL